MECYSAGVFDFFRVKLECFHFEPNYKARGVLNIEDWFDYHTEWLTGPGVVYSEKDTNEVPLKDAVNVSSAVDSFCARPANDLK